MLAEEIFDHFAVDAVECRQTEEQPTVMEVVVGAGAPGVFLEKLLY